MTNTPLDQDALDKAADAVARAAGACGVELYGADEDIFAERAVSAYLAVAQPVVNSVEELDALPVGSVIRGEEDDLVSEKIRHSPYLPYWVTTGNEVEADERDLFPARVLYLPTEELTNGR